MTNDELILILQQYPTDSIVHVNASELMVEGKQDWGIVTSATLSTDSTHILLELT